MKPWLAALLIVTPAALNAESPNILQSLVRQHPRLLATSSDFARLQRDVRTDPNLKAWHNKLIRHADDIVRAAPAKYEIPDGLRLLATSRKVLDRVTTLALLYRLGGDRRYVERVWQELNAAAHFPDWNPRHFLDTAEMTHAFAIGYDWLYDQWTPKQRQMIREAIIQKGLLPARECYRGSPRYKILADIALQLEPSLQRRNRHGRARVGRRGTGAGQRNPRQRDEIPAARHE